MLRVASCPKSSLREPHSWCEEAAAHAEMVLNERVGSLGALSRPLPFGAFMNGSQAEVLLSTER